MTQIRTGYSDKDKRQLICRRLFYLLLFGVMIGVVLWLRAPEIAASAVMQQGFDEPIGERSLLAVFRGSFSATAVLLLVSFLLGFFAVGQPFALSVLLLRGAALGCAVGSTYSMYGIRGLPMVLFLQLPHAAVTSLLLILAVRETLTLSTQFFRFAVCDCERDGVRDGCRYYLLRYLVLFVGLLLSAAADTALTYFLTALVLP